MAPSPAPATALLLLLAGTAAATDTSRAAALQRICSQHTQSLIIPGEEGCVFRSPVRGSYLTLQDSCAGFTSSEGVSSLWSGSNEDAADRALMSLYDDTFPVHVPRIISRGTQSSGCGLVIFGSGGLISQVETDLHCGTEYRGICHFQLNPPPPPSPPALSPRAEQLQSVCSQHSHHFVVPGTNDTCIFLSPRFGSPDTAMNSCATLASDAGDYAGWSPASSTDTSLMDAYSARHRLRSFVWIAQDEQDGCRAAVLDPSGGSFFNRFPGCNSHYWGICQFRLHPPPPSRPSTVTTREEILRWTCQQLPDSLILADAETCIFPTKRPSTYAEAEADCSSTMWDDVELSLWDGGASDARPAALLQYRNAFPAAVDGGIFRLARTDDDGACHAIGVDSAGIHAFRGSCDFRLWGLCAARLPPPLTPAQVRLQDFCTTRPHGLVPRGATDSCLFLTETTGTQREAAALCESLSSSHGTAAAWDGGEQADFAGIMAEYRDDGLGTRNLWLAKTASAPLTCRVLIVAGDNARVWNTACSQHFQAMCVFRLHEPRPPLPPSDLAALHTHCAQRPFGFVLNGTDTCFFRTAGTGSQAQAVERCAAEPAVAIGSMRGTSAIWEASALDDADAVLDGLPHGNLFWISKHDARCRALFADEPDRRGTLSDYDCNAHFWGLCALRLAPAPLAPCVQASDSPACYWIEQAAPDTDDHYDWDSGRAKCAGHAGGQIASVLSPSENDFAVSLWYQLIAQPDRTKGLWIGASSRAVEGSFQWSTTGAALGYTNWDSEKGEPNNWGNSEDCVLYWRRTGTGNSPKWHDGRCTARHAVLCERRATHLALPEHVSDCVSTPGSGTCAWIPAGVHRDWWSAQQYCLQFEGARLATVLNGAEDRVLAAQWSTLRESDRGGGMWIGAHDLVTENRFEWVSGAAWSYTNWHPGQPNNIRNQDCVAMGVWDASSSEVDWGDGDCMEAYAFACEVRPQ